MNVCKRQLGLNTAPLSYVISQVIEPDTRRGRCDRRDSGREYGGGRIDPMSLGPIPGFCLRTNAL
jgi:hypothetical protein